MVQDIFLGQSVKRLSAIFITMIILLCGLMAFLPNTHAWAARDCKKADTDQGAQINLCPVENGGVKANGSTINSVKNIVFGLAGSLAFLFIVIGGVRYILSRGDPNSTAQAKNTIIYALVGLIVTILAYAIVGFVLGSI